MCNNIQLTHCKNYHSSCVRALSESKTTVRGHCAVSALSIPCEWATAILLVHSNGWIYKPDCSTVTLGNSNKAVTPQHAYAYFILGQGFLTNFVKWPKLAWMADRINEHCSSAWIYALILTSETLYSATILLRTPSYAKKRRAIKKRLSRQPQDPNMILLHWH